MKKWGLRLGLGMLLLALVGGLLAHHFRQRAVAFGVDGAAIADLLHQYADAIQNGAPTAALFTGDGAHPPLGWDRELRQEFDGIRHYRWLPGTHPIGEGYRRLASVKMKLLAFTAGPFDRERKTALVRLWIQGVHRTLGTVEERGVFEMVFRKTPAGWRIERQRLESGETVAAASRRATFRDVTRRAGLAMPAEPDLRAGESRLFLSAVLVSAVAAGDFDNDGWTDVLATSPGGQSVRLFHNDHGRFVDVTEKAGLRPALTRATQSILVFDYDNDGWPDIFLGRKDGNTLLHNRGDGTFEDATAGSGLERSGPCTAMACAGDYDRDGRLDLYLANYYQPGVPVDDFFRSQNGPGDQLYRNLGNGRFQDFTHAAGLEHHGRSLACGFVDMDDDGWPDLFVADDFGFNHLYRNRGDGTFQDVSFAAGLRDMGSFMSFDAADTRARGTLDLYATKIDSNSQWYWEEAMDLQPEANLLKLPLLWKWFRRRKWLAGHLGRDGDDRRQARLKMAGNSLYVATAPGRFERAHVGASAAGWAWAGLFLDYDNDGYPDIYVANGWISGKKHDDL